MTRLYFIRHGESDGNEKKYFQGQLDTPLTKLGERQAELTAQYLKAFDIDMIFSSDLKRTLFTAGKIGELSGLDVTKCKELREIDAGLWQGVHFERLAKDYPEYQTWLTDIGNAVCTKGESIRQLQSRVNKAINRIVCENKDKKIVIVTHGGPIRALNCLWNNSPLSQMKNIPWVPNSSITTVDYDDNKTPYIIQFGYDKHLGEISTTFGANV